MAWWRRRPDPPEDVKLHLRDGTVVPVECVYEGWHFDWKVGHRMHYWRAVNSPDITADNFENISVGKLPGYTRLTL